MELEIEIAQTTALVAAGVGVTMVTAIKMIFINVAVEIAYQ